MRSGRSVNHGRGRKVEVDAVSDPWDREEEGLLGSQAEEVRTSSSHRLGLHLPDHGLAGE